jgi:sugar lactone lactonase YvrE
MTTATQFSAAITGLGEGPFFDERIGKLILVDLLRGDVLTLDDSGSASRKHVSTIASVVRPRSSGGYLIGIERGIEFFTDDLEPTGREIIAVDTPGLRMNDGGCDPQGRGYVGSMAYEEKAGAGALYRFDTDGTVATVLTGLTVANGIQWSADGTRVFHNDTPTGRIAVHDFDQRDGTLHDQRDFVVLPEGVGLPDGMAIDDEDGVWIALWGGSAVHRYDAAGRLSEVIDLPASKVTCPTFGGPDRRTLYITTASLDVSADDEPGAGAVFVAEPGVTGATPQIFAG